MTVRSRQFALLVDFGSTYTKLVAVDLDIGRIIGRAQALTTVETDINAGLEEALAHLEETCSLTASQFTFRSACSSAAGGLRVIAIGCCEKSLTVGGRSASGRAGGRRAYHSAHTVIV